MLGVSACGPFTTVPLTLLPTPTSTSTPSEALNVVNQVSFAKQIANSAQGNFSASVGCSPGNIMLSGGYSITGGTNAQQADVLDSYPTNSTTWSVTGLNASVGGALTLTAYVDCLHTNLNVTTTIATAGPGSGVVTANCPAGSVTSGGGYQGSGHFSAFGAAGSGWAAALAGSGSTTVYAICLSGGLMTSAAPNASAAVAANGTGTATTGKCPSGQLLVGGGYTATPPATVFTSSFDQANLTHWTVQASDRSFGSAPNLSVTALGVCLTL
jgi:hypothetical protein